MQWRQTHLHEALWCRLVSKVESISKPIITQSIALESITFSFVGDPEFVTVMPLEADGLFIHCKVLSKQPSWLKHTQHMTKEVRDFPIWFSVTGWRVNRRVLHCKEGLEIPVAALCILPHVMT